MEVQEIKEQLKDIFRKVINNSNEEMNVENDKWITKYDKEGEPYHVNIDDTEDKSDKKDINKRREIVVGCDVSHRIILQQICLSLRGGKGLTTKQSSYFVVINKLNGWIAVSEPRLEQILACATRHNSQNEECRLWRTSKKPRPDGLEMTWLL